jgi:uncharacterized protein (DUF58 family)
MIPRELFQKIRRLEIRTKGLVENVFGGEYHSAFKGRGIESADVRPYQFGDDIRNIDWNVTARMDETYVKTYEEERQQTLMLAVDVSGSESFGSKKQYKRETAAEICALIAFSAIQNNDNVGLLLFSDEIELFVPPKKGRRHVLRLIRDLFAHETQSRGTDISVALDHMLHVLQRRSIVILISDFLDEGFEKPLRALSRRHDTVGIHLVDPRERELPNMGLLTLTDPETGEETVVDTATEEGRRRFAEEQEERERELDVLFRRTAMDAVRISTDEGYVEPLVAFFRKRHRVQS